MTGDRIPAPVFQVDRLLRMVGDDSAFICKVLAAFRATTPELLSTLFEAHRGGDNEALSTAAHQMKGSCLTIGAEALAQTCDQLEAAACHREVGDIPELLKRAESQLNELEEVLAQRCPEPPPPIPSRWSP